jgi:ribosome maturation factor RimP
MQELEKVIARTVESFISDESLFLVGVTVTGRGRYHVQVMLDGDKGITIEQCVEISQLLGQELEAMDLIDGPYELEVGSPGVGEPLKMVRQYQANVGRKVSILTLEGGQPKVGKLLEVGENQLQIAEEYKVKHKIMTRPLTIDFAAIKEIKVTVSFK